MSVLTAEDRIALILGRAIIRAETLEALLLAARAELAAASAEQPAPTNPPTAAAVPPDAAVG